VTQVVADHQLMLAQFSRSVPAVWRNVCQPTPVIPAQTVMFFLDFPLGSIENNSPIFLQELVLVFQVKHRYRIIPMSAILLRG
jgi:hypothetical protein